MKLPKHHNSEADLVGEFFHQSRVAGLEVHLEVILPSSVHRSKKFRVDAVVVHGDEIVCCIEVKRHGREINADTRQYRAYRWLEYDHRIPTIWINDRAGIPEVIRSIVLLLKREYRVARMA